MELVIGKVGRAHGLTGEVAVEVRTDQPELRFVPGAVLGLEGGAVPDGRPTVTLESVRSHGQRLLVRFEGCTDRTTAERLHGAMLTVDVSEDETPDDPDEFYDHQLVGLTAVTVGGERLGEVHEVVHLPMQDLLAVRTVEAVGSTGWTEILVPFVQDIVTDIDLTVGQVLVDLPPGLWTPVPEGPTSPS